MFLVYSSSFKSRSSPLSNMIKNPCRIPSCIIWWCKNKSKSCHWKSFTILYTSCEKLVLAQPLGRTDCEVYFGPNDPINDLEVFISSKIFLLICSTFNLRVKMSSVCLLNIWPYNSNVKFYVLRFLVNLTHC